MGCFTSASSGQLICSQWINLTPPVGRKLRVVDSIHCYWTSKHTHSGKWQRPPPSDRKVGVLKHAEVEVRTSLWTAQSRKASLPALNWRLKIPLRIGSPDFLPGIFRVHIQALISCILHCLPQGKGCKWWMSVTVSRPLKRVWFAHVPPRWSMLTYKISS